MVCRGMILIAIAVGVCALPFYAAYMVRERLK
jgi:hypothetical protein